METKLLLTLGGFFILNMTVVAQSNIRISDESYEAKGCGDIESVYKKIDLESSSIYMKSEKKPVKGQIQLYVRDNETCKEQKLNSFAQLNPYTYDTEFLPSPKKQFALLVEKDYSYSPKGFHALNQSGEVVWKLNWEMKSGDVALVVMNADIDDEGNASFFVKAEQKKEGTAYAFVYRDAEDGNLKVIGYALDVNGRVTFRNKFDQWGYIHFMGAFERKDTKETGETKRGIFHGKVDPQEEDKLNTTLYPFKELKKYDSNWTLTDYKIDDEGNITLCGLGYYMKGGAGRDFSKIFLIQLDKDGKEKWSHLITTINLMKNPSLGQGKFLKIGNNYAYLYYDNEEYIKYPEGIDVETVSSEPKQDELQMYVVDAAGKLSKYAIGPISIFGKYGLPEVTETNDALYLKGAKGSRKIEW